MKFSEEWRLIVPKYEFLHPEGNLLNVDLKNFLLQFFKESDLHKIERLGGRISISITAPYSEKRGKKQNNIEINGLFINELQRQKGNIQEIKNILTKLNVKELRKLSESVGQPIRSNANAAEIRSELTKLFQAEDIWQRISGLNSDS
jgi:hypothetical protein